MKEENLELVNCYADKLPYIIEKTSVYFGLRGSQLLNKLGCSLTIEQFITLDTIAFNRGICQRDLAKIVLKDRSNITRILNILEKKGLITRASTSKGNRMVKTANLTPEGKIVIEKYSAVMKTDLDAILSDIEPEKLNIITEILSLIIDKISKNTNIQI